MSLLFFVLALLFPLASFALTAYVLYYMARPKKDDALLYPKHLWIALLLPALGLNIFAYQVEFGFGLGVFFALLVAGITMATPPNKRSWLHFVLGGVGIAAALLFTIRANEFVQVINLLTVLCSIIGLLLLTAAQKIEWFSGWILVTLWRYILRSLRQLPLLARSVFSVKTSSHPYINVAVKTTLFTLVLLLFFAFILAQADPVFANLVEDVLDQLVGRTILTVVLLGALLVVLGISLVPAPAKKPTMKWLGFIETIVPLGAVALLFGVFLLIQIKYLFGSHGDFSALGITYSDYVRKGFIELLIATFFGAVLTYIVALKRHALRSSTSGVWIGALNAVVIVQLGLLLTSAVKRDVMYIETYGLTRVRLIGGVFLVWLAVQLIALLWFALRNKSQEKHVLLSVLWSSICAVLVLNVWNLDAHIAAAEPPRNEPTDYFYIAALSYDAADGWQSMLNDATSIFAEIQKQSEITENAKVQLANIKLAMVLLQDEWQRLQNRFTDHYKWQNYRYADYKAHAWFTGNALEPVKQAQCLFTEVYDWQFEHGVDLYDYEYDRLYRYEYPFVHINTSYYPYRLDSLDDDWYIQNTLGTYGMPGSNRVAEDC